MRTAFALAALFVAALAATASALVAVDESCVFICEDSPEPQCLFSRAQVQDGYTDCASGADEVCQGSGCCYVDDAVGFLCEDFVTCLPLSGLNNGSVECPGRLDEEFSCPEFTCIDGACLPFEKVGDGYVDCIGGSDEEGDGCAGFRCGDGSCISLELVLNGYTDCADGSDEHGGDGDGGVGCPEFTCGDGTTCILFAQLGDGYTDCPDGSDEAGDGGGGSTGGGSSGDPHFLSLDGHYFDYQGLGKHLYCGTANVQVTTCHAPWVHNPTMAAVNRAVAVGRAGAGVFEVEFVGGAFVTRIDGSPVSLSSGQSAAVGSAGTVRRTGDSYLFVASSGESVRLDTESWAQWINIQVSGSFATGSTQGLCGNGNNLMADDFKLRSGVALPLYSAEAAATFGLDWRVQAGEDLLSAAVNCPETADGYAAYYISAADVRRTPDATSARRPAAQTFDAAAFVRANANEALNCLTDEERDALNFGSENDRARVLQLIYDLIFFHNPTEGTNGLGRCADDDRVRQQGFFTVAACADNSACNARGRCVNAACVCDAGWTGADCSVPQEPVAAEEFVALCDPQGGTSCASFSGRSATRSIRLLFRPDGTCQ